MRSIHGACIFLTCLLVAVNLFRSPSGENKGFIIHNTRTPQDTIATQRCALNFYGLPRSFASIVLPTVIENVLIPNANHSCDVFVYYHALDKEPPGRSGNGGSIDPHEIRQLEPVIQRLLGVDTVVEFNSFQDEEFRTEYAELLDNIQTVKNPDGTWRYRVDNFPTETQMNIIKMWHQQLSVWRMMMDSARRRNIEYTRVAMLRNDVAFVTAIDVWSPERGVMPDVNNSLAIIPGFHQYPVNDRFMLGPRPAAEIWAAQRFELLEEHLDRIGTGIHSEQFLAHTLLPRIRELGVEVFVDEGICFGRVRADGSVWLSDCGSDWVRYNEVLESILRRPCVIGGERYPSKGFVKFLKCPLNETQSTDRINGTQIEAI